MFTDLWYDVVEAGENCDGDCLLTCFDGDFGTDDVRTGSSDSCDVACAFTAVTVCRRVMAAVHPGAYSRQMKIAPESAVTVSLKPVKNVMMAIQSTQETAVRLNVAIIRYVVMAWCRAFLRPVMMVSWMLVVAVMRIARVRKHQAVAIVYSVPNSNLR